MWNLPRWNLHAMEKEKSTNVWVLADYFALGGAVFDRMWGTGFLGVLLLVWHDKWECLARFCLSSVYVITLGVKRVIRCPKVSLIKC